MPTPHSPYAYQGGHKGSIQGGYDQVLKGDNMSHPDPAQCYRDINCKDNTCGECDNCNFEEWYQDKMVETGFEDQYLGTFFTKDAVREFARGIYNNLYGAD